MTYRIGELANAGGVPVSTIRYYERRGLIDAPKRSAGNYRVFGEDSLKRLRFIQAAQKAGFTLSNIETLLQLTSDSRNTCQCVQTLIEERLDGVRKQLRQLEITKDWLGRLLLECRAQVRNGTCPVLDQLEHRGIDGAD